MKLIIPKIQLSLLGLGIIILLSVCHSNKDVINQTDSKIEKNQLAFIMCEGESCQTTSTIPVGDYILDEERTYCEAGGKISNYDSTLGTIKYVVKGNDECKVYFTTPLQLEPIINQTFSSGTSIIVKNEDDITSGTFDTQIETPVDYDEIEYIDFKELGLSGEFVDEYGNFDFWENDLTNDFCDNYNFCYTVSSIYDVKISQALFDSIWDDPNYGQISFNPESTLQFNYLFYSDGDFTLYFAFRLKKKGYKPSAWYLASYGWNIAS
ncbi:MAG: hypothetical protein E7164_01630 [Firmicutes bacterium]|nr:hypothetical protein [Bacillota bacterium]